MLFEWDEENNTKNKIIKKQHQSHHIQSILHPLHRKILTVKEIAKNN